MKTLKHSTSLAKKNANFLQKTVEIRKTEEH